MNQREKDINDHWQSIIAMTANLPELDPAIAAEYFGYMNELLAIHAAHIDRFDALVQQAAACTTRFTYATGHIAMPRGVLCPSQVMDLLIHGCKRGRPLARLTKSTKDYLRYSMDKQDRLLKVEQFINNSVYDTEILIRDQNRIYGITRRSHQSLEVYDDTGRLAIYVIVMPDWYSAHRFHNIFYSEKVEYDDRGRIAFVHHASGTPGLKLFETHTHQAFFDTASEHDAHETDTVAYKADQSRAKRRRSIDLASRLNRLLERRGFPEILDADAAIAAFEELSKIRIDTESDDLLIEAGPQIFSGEKLFWLSLARQYDTPDPDNSEYLQLRFDLLFQPDDRLMPFIMSEWSNGDREAFFVMIRGSKLLECIRQHGIRPVRFSVTLDET